MTTAEEIEALFGGRAYIRERELLAVLQLSHSTLWRWERDGLFPAASRFGSRVKAWRVKDIVRWLVGREEGP